MTEEEEEEEGPPRPNSDLNAVTSRVELSTAQVGAFALLFDGKSTRLLTLDYI